MAHEMEWIDEPWIMQVIYKDKITVDDVETIMTRCLAAADKHPIYFWVDLRDTKFHDPKVFRSGSLTKLLRHPNTKNFAVTGVTGLWQHLLPTLMRFTSFKAFNNGDEALAFLRGIVEQHKAEVGEVAAPKQKAVIP